MAARSSPSRVPSLRIVRAVSGRFPRKSSDIVAWSIARNLANARSEYCGFLRSGGRARLARKSRKQFAAVGAAGVASRFVFTTANLAETADQRQDLHMKTGAMQLHHHAIGVLRSFGHRYRMKRSQLHVAVQRGKKEAGFNHGFVDKTLAQASA